MATATKKSRVESRESSAKGRTKKKKAAPAAGNALKSLPNGQAAWECSECGEWNDGPLVWCISCGPGMRPNLNAVERLLARVIGADFDAKDAIDRLAKEGAGDALLLSQVSTILTTYRPDEVGLQCDDGTIAWTVSEKRQPAFYLGVDKPAPRQQPDLVGKPLIATLRDLFWIGKEPAAETATKPSPLNVPLVSIERLHNSYSGETIMPNGIIKPPVEIEGRLWICVAVVSRPAKDTNETRTRELEVYEAIPRDEWQGPPTVSREITESMRQNPNGAYHGLMVTAGDDDALFVLSGPERMVDTHGVLDVAGNGSTKPKRATKKRRTKKPTAAEQQIHDTVCPTGREEAKQKQAAKKRTPATSNNGDLPSGDVVAAGTRLDVRMSYIVPSPFQPRTEFDQEKLKQLGASIKEHGQTADCLVRQIAKNKFELIGGERRFRACKLVKLKTLACKVIVADDKKARSLAVFDNLDREDLNEIDRIRAYRDLLDNGVYATQDELAQSIGIKPASLSNLLRILKLPADWLQMISQEMLPVTHARYVIPWTERPAVLAELKLAIDEGELGDLQEWQYSIHHAVKDNSRPLSGEFFGKRPGDEYSRWHKVRLTKKEQADEDLDVVDVKGMGKRAFNIDLWEELQTAGEERAKKRAGKGKSNSANGELTEADAKQKAKARREKFAKRIWMYKVGWLQRQLAAKIRELEPLAGGADQQRGLSLLLYFCEHPLGHGQWRVGEAIREAGAKVKTGGNSDWQGIVQADCRQLWEAARNSAAAWVLQTPWSYHTGVDDRTVVAMADSFGVNVKRDWHIEPEYLELLSKDQASDLAAEWKIDSHKVWLSAPRNKRSELIAGLTTVGEVKKLPCPKALADAKRPNGFHF